MRARTGLVVLLSAVAFGCGPKVDLAKGLQVADVSSGWADKGIVDGQNKLVPSLSFTLKNVSDQSLVALDLNTVFHQGTEQQAWDTELVNVSGSEGLAAGTASKHITVDSQKGYTGTETRAEMMKNSHFVDAKVELFAKYGNTQWVRIGDYAITRQLLAR